MDARGVQNAGVPRAANYTESDGSGFTDQPLQLQRRRVRARQDPSPGHVVDPLTRRTHRVLRQEESIAVPQVRGGQGDQFVVARPISVL